MVWSRDDQTLAHGYRPVIGTKRTENQPIYEVVIRNSVGQQETLLTTEEHPFWIKDHGWLKAALLESGMVLLDRDDQMLEVVSQTKLARLDTVYNIEVEELHTYHVGTLGTWVHNAGCCEVILPSVKTYEQARNKALSLVGDLGLDSKPSIGRLPASSGFGQVIGRESADGKVRWRLDYDPEKKIHINIEDFRGGKGVNAKKYVIQFVGDESLYISLLKQLNR